jgi:hypothetical protein
LKPQLKPQWLWAAVASMGRYDTQKRRFTQYLLMFWDKEVVINAL